MKCNFCDRQAVYTRPYEKKPLCLVHFNRSFISRVKRTISRFKMLQPRDVVAVGLSGGKDSVVLVHVLASVMKKFPTSRLVAITIDEGIKNYREESLEIAKKHASALGIEHHVFSFEELFGYGLDNFLVKITDNNGKRKGACAYCGIFRRRALNQAALEIGADKVATGHNLDDEAQTVLMNMLRGDLGRFGRADYSPRYKHEKFVPRIKPFLLTPEAEIVLYAVLNGLEYQEMPCPHSVEADRGVIREMMKMYLERNPGAMFNLVRMGSELSDLIRLKEQSSRPLSECSKCGNPTAGKICKVCSILAEVEEASL